MATERDVDQLLRELVGGIGDRVMQGRCARGGRSGETVIVSLDHISATGTNWIEARCWGDIAIAAAVTLMKTDVGEWLAIPQAQPESRSRLDDVQLRRRRPREEEISSIKVLYRHETPIAGEEEYIGYRYTWYVCGFSSTPTEIYTRDDIFSEAGSYQEITYLENLGSLPDQWRVIEAHEEFDGEEQTIYYSFLSPSGTATYSHPEAYGSEFNAEDEEFDKVLDSQTFYYPVSGDWVVEGLFSEGTNNLAVFFFFRKRDGGSGTIFPYTFPYAGATYSFGYHWDGEAIQEFIVREAGRYSQSGSSEDGLLRGEHDKIMLPNGYSKPVVSEIGVGYTWVYRDYWFPVVADLQAGTAILGHVETSHTGEGSYPDNYLVSDLYFYDNGTEVLIDQSGFQEPIFEFSPGSRTPHLQGTTRTLASGEVINCLFIRTATTSFKGNRLFYLPPEHNGVDLQNAIRIGTNRTLSWPVITYTIAPDGSVSRGVRNHRFYGVPSELGVDEFLTVEYLSFYPS